MPARRTTMTARNGAARWILTATLLLGGCRAAAGFAPVAPPRRRALCRRPASAPPAARPPAPRRPDRRRAELRMANDDGAGPGPVAAAFSVLVLLFFAVSALAPLADFATHAPTDFSLGDAVATRGDAATSRLQNYRSAYDALGPAKVQEKLRNLPAFYVTADDGAGPAMSARIYLSCAEAEAAAARSSDAAAAVRATTLDQVLYPLVLGRETPKTTIAPPADVAAALRARARGDGAPRSYALVPSAAALRDAPDAAPRPGDAPLFVVDRLAFAGADGRPTVPLFTERGEARASYARLRDAGGGALPATPTVRTTTLRDVLESMEGGTRPAVGQLAFYGNAEDALRAEAMGEARASR